MFSITNYEPGLPVINDAIFKPSLQDYGLGAWAPFVLYFEKNGGNGSGKCNHIERKH